MSEFVSINAHTIRANAKNGTNNPPIRIAKTKSDKSPRYAHQIKINGPSELIYDPNGRILACGARLVLKTTNGAVEIIE